MEFTRESAGQYGESLGTTTLYVDDKPVTKGPMRAQIGRFTLSGTGLCVGYDTGDAVSSQYQFPGIFTGGTIQGVGFDVSKEVYLDLQREAAGALARD
jgi:arylsulfatase